MAKIPIVETFLYQPAYWLTWINQQSFLRAGCDFIAGSNFKGSWLALWVLVLGGCIDLHDINLYDVRISEEQTNSLKSNPEIEAIHYFPQSLEFYYPTKHLCLPTYSYRSYGPAHCPYNHHVFTVEDPAPLIQDHFLDGLRTKLDLHNIRSNSEALPPSKDQNPAVRQSIGSGLKLMFETRKWQLWKHDPRDTALDYSTSYDLVDTNPQYRLYYVGRGMLIRLEDLKILWRGACNAELDFEMENGPVPSRLQIAENSPSLTKARDLIATKCGNELLKKFFYR